MAEQSVKKAPAKKSDKKPGFFAKASRFFREMKAESKKVVWPSKKQIINNTGIVLGVMAVVGGGIWIVDWIFALLRGLLF
jgi:preprotein translocase subunit SecE